jgi:Family of unknown function (DUF6052)
MATDLLGNALTPQEQRLLDLYTGLKELAAEEDLPPTAAANVRHALAQLAQAVNSLALAHEHLTDLEI